MFYHAFNGYMDHAFPLDELRPHSCGGEDSLGGYALTLIDALETLALLGDRESFAASVEWIGKNLQFKINKTVSVFEGAVARGQNVNNIYGLVADELVEEFSDPINGVTSPV
ncbi:putative glycoside hydrolase family 47 [Rosa chinensis]|uniref:alpha-1,2-Mannosidase n=2 Tax=Rosa chinensis TaxID=74649 RepID=A0A2P6QVE6_ROSCH|nr:putative glycoside hydrolase family 47 [Rosa chinensis]